jgi:anti-sigma-K factor RskA
MSDRHATIAPLLTDYVLGELDATQRREVEAHLPGCAACAKDVRELTAAFHSIGVAERPVAPPAALRARVLAQMQSGPTAVKPVVDRRLSRWTSNAWLLAVAATVIVALGSLLVQSMRRTAGLTDALRRADLVYEEITERLAQNDTQADLAVSILTAGDMRRIELSAGDASREALGRAYFSPSKGLLIVADQLPEPPSGRVYQVWLIGNRSAGPVSAGLLTSPRTGRGMLIVPAPSGVAGDTVTVAITDEPPGGLPSPTGAKHLIGS